MTQTEQVLAVQRKLGLTADGIAGPQTWAGIFGAIVGVATAAPAVPPEVSVVPTFQSSNNWPREADAANFYGRSDGSEQWQNANLVHIVPPYAMNMDGTPIHVITCHRLVADSLARILVAIKAHFGSDPSAIHDAGLDRYDGCYNFRNVRGSSHLSMHSYGAAIDLDAEHNPLESTNGKMPLAVVAIFTSEGWRWGGNYSGRKDPMHYEACT